MNTTNNEYYSNVRAKPMVGHQTNKGEITEIDSDGRVSISGYQGSFRPDALELTLSSKDIVEYQSMEHLNTQVLMAFMHGHIVQHQGEDYRFARQDQHLYEEGDMIYVAMESGVFKRCFSYSGTDMATPTGFKWILSMGETDGAFSLLLGMIEAMTQDEKIMAVANLAFDKVQRTHR